MFHEILSSLIKERKVNKKDVAEHIGVARSTLNNVLEGKSYLNSRQIEKLAEFFDVPAGYFFTTKKEESSIMEILDQHQKQINELTKTIETLQKPCK
ncbi:MAG: helix-turn-helix transcriptional regulator [Proteiniphilum sp.]